jgi:hypothetical protein
MSHILTDLGEEWVLETALEGVSVTIGLYNDGTDSIGDTDDLSALTSEPSDGNYARQSASLTLADESGDWAAKTGSDVTFDVTNTTGTVDSYFIVANFTADDTGDSGANDHLVSTGELSQNRDLSQIDTLTISAGSMGILLT